MAASIRRPLADGATKGKQPFSSQKNPRGSGVEPRSLDEAPGAAIVSNIHWITDKELALASQGLRRLKRIGRQLERHGDYFGSGNLAYQLRQIVTEIRSLMQSTSRVQRRN